MVGVADLFTFQTKARSALLGLAGQCGELTSASGNTSHLAGMGELTETQRHVFDFIRQKLVGGFPAPTSREVAAQFGWSSKRAADDHIEALIRKGFLVADPGKARSLRLKDAPQGFRRAV